MELFTGTFSSPDQSMIGRWRFYNIFLAFSIPIKLIGLGMTRFVGFLLGVVFLNLSPTARLSLMKTFIEPKLRISIIFSNLKK